MEEEEEVKEEEKEEEEKEVEEEEEVREEEVKEEEKEEEAYVETENFPPLVEIIEEEVEIEQQIEIFEEEVEEEEEVIEEEIIEEEPIEEEPVEEEPVEEEPVEEEPVEEEPVEEELIEEKNIEIVEVTEEEIVEFPNLPSVPIAPKAIEPQVLHDDILEFIPSAQPQPTLLFEETTLFKPEKKSLNDLLTEKKDDNSLGAKFQQSHISDLTKAIAINEKFSFIRELFHNSGVDFSNAIQKLNECQNIDVAFNVMEELKHQYLWDTTSSSYLTLCDLVRRRFL